MSELTTDTLRTSMWWNPFTTERVRLSSPYSPDECRKRVYGNIYSFWRGTDPTSPFSGGRWVRSFILSMSSTVALNRFMVFRFQHAFQPYAKVRIRPAAINSASVTIRLSLHPIIRAGLALLLVAFMGVFLLSLLGAVGVVMPFAPNVPDPLSVVRVASFVYGALYLFYLGGFWISRDERVYLVSAIQRVLRASDALPGA